MSPAEFIAQNNPDAVVAFARQHGHQISNDPREAYAFLKAAWDTDPEAVKAAMPMLNPLANFSGGQLNTTPRAVRRISRYRHFDGSQYDDQGEESDFMDILERGINKGKEMASSMFNNNNNTNQNQKDHTKEILTYGAVLLAGIFIGKFLMK